jgi:hypothetical protein
VTPYLALAGLILHIETAAAWFLRPVSGGARSCCLVLLSCISVFVRGSDSLPREDSYSSTLVLSLSRFSFSIGFSNLRATSHRRATRTLACLGQHADEVTALRHAKLRSPGEPCHRFDLNRFRFLVRLVGSIDFHRSSLVRLGFVFVSRSVPADNVASLLLCLGPCLIRSREECKHRRLHLWPCSSRFPRPQKCCLIFRFTRCAPWFPFNHAAECFVSAGPISL